MSDSNNDIEQSSTIDKKISTSMKWWLKNKANEYPCPDCGSIMNKSNRKNHYRSQKHRLAVLTKLVEKNKHL